MVTDQRPETDSRAADSELPSRESDVVEWIMILFIDVDKFDDETQTKPANKTSLVKDQSRQKPSVDVSVLCKCRLGRLRKRTNAHRNICVGFGPVLSL